MAPSGLFLRTGGMGVLRSRLEPAARLPPSGRSGGSSVLVGLGQVRRMSSQPRGLLDLSDGLTYKHVFVVAGLHVLYITAILAQRAWKKPRLEAAIRYYDQQIVSV